MHAYAISLLKNYDYLELVSIGNTASYSINVKNTLIQLHDESYSKKKIKTCCETTSILKLALILDSSWLASSLWLLSDSSFFDSEVNATVRPQGNSNSKLQGNLEKHNTIHIVAI